MFCSNTGEIRLQFVLTAAALTSSRRELGRLSVSSVREQAQAQAHTHKHTYPHRLSKEKQIYLPSWVTEVTMLATSVCGHE